VDIGTDCSVMVVNVNSGTAWSEQDLLELGQLYAVGFPVAHVAKFLMRDLEEVKERVNRARPCPIS
jgi:hypothetical protein